MRRFTYAGLVFLLSCSAVQPAPAVSATPAIPPNMADKAPKEPVTRQNRLLMEPPVSRPFMMGIIIKGLKESYGDITGFKDTSVEVVGNDDFMVAKIETNGRATAVILASPQMAVLLGKLLTEYEQQHNHNNTSYSPRGTLGASQ